MKQYKVVSIDYRNSTASCNEHSFSGIYGQRGQQYLLDYYAKQGWRFIQIMRDFHEINKHYYMYFERDVAE